MADLDVTPVMCGTPQHFYKMAARDAIVYVDYLIRFGLEDLSLLLWVCSLRNSFTSERAVQRSLKLRDGTVEVLNMKCERG
jgi:hypothetical protein